MSGFTKLFGAIVYSTIWREDKHTKIVWITMLALADRRGRVMSSVPGLADASRVSIQECEEALAILKAPDPYSRTPEYEGRRIETCDGGWLLLNYQKYRELREEDERREQVREAVKRHRDRKREKQAQKPAGSTIGDEDEEHVRIVRDALRVLAPRMRAPERAYVGSWLAKADGDIWKLLARFCEVEPHIAKAKSCAYLSRITTESAQNGWPTSLASPELNREFVLHRLGGLI